MATLPGFDRFRGLRVAGMPEAADEHADPHVAPPMRPVSVDAFAATPTTILARAWWTPRGCVLWPRAAPVLIRRGAAVPAGAVWQDATAQTGADTAFVDAAVARAGRKRSDPIVLMSDGTFGYDAALHLAGRGFSRIFWYRGGEEAWAAAKRLPRIAAPDVRPTLLAPCCTGLSSGRFAAILRRAAAEEPHDEHRHVRPAPDPQCLLYFRRLLGGRSLSVREVSLEPDIRSLIVTFPPGPPKIRPELRPDLAVSLGHGPEDGVVIAPLDLTGMSDAEIARTLPTGPRPSPWWPRPSSSLKAQLAAAVAAIKR